MQADGTYLLLSSSRAGSGSYLEHAESWLRQLLGLQGITTGLFVPFAAVMQSYDAYHEEVAGVFARQGVELASLHEQTNARAAIAEAELLVVGGGNTFALAARLQAAGLMRPLAQRAVQVAYVGWSAGANIAAPSLATTNDMPIVEPASFATLGRVGFQINPHYTAQLPPGHNGETRSQRLAEYCQLNPDSTVVALPEGRALLGQYGQVRLLGGDAWLFAAGKQRQLPEQTDLLDWL